MKNCTPWPLLVVLTLCVTPVFAADEEPAATERPPEVTERTDKAVAKALEWLARNQNKDGSQKSGYPCASAALAGLAWLAAGSTPTEGPHARNINLTLDYILRCSSKSGFISENGGNGPSGMYGHGYSTQFLAQVYGMIREEGLAGRVHDALAKAVQSIESTQNQYGGWNSSPNAALTDDGSGAIAVMQITALRSAETAGVPIRQQAISKARKYLLDMTNEHGWYAYNWHARSSAARNGSVALTGAGMYMLGCLGLQTDAKYVKGIKNIMGNLPGRSEAGFGGWYAYSLYYASIAIFQHGGQEWRKWYPAMVDNLIKTQNADGSWNDSYGGVFTALSVLALELPYRYLPMFQDGGAGAEGR